jgi:putative oxidoreductase
VKLGALLIRGVVGPLFIGHGTQKLFGWFGGHGVEGTAGYFESLGLRPGQRHARSAGAAEAGGGLLLTLGLLTPVGAATIIGTMATAIRKAHAENGPWVTNGGYEYNLVLIAAMTALAENGPGPLSADRTLFPGLRGGAAAALALGAGVAGSYLVTSDLVSEEPGAAQDEPGGAAGHAEQDGSREPEPAGARS